MGLQGTSFHKGVDPWGILRGMAKGDSTCSYMHTEDNQVQYFTAYRDGNGNRRSVNCIFKIDVSNSLLPTVRATPNSNSVDIVRALQGDATVLENAIKL